MAHNLDTLQAPELASAFAGYVDETSNLGAGIVGGFPTIGYRSKIWSLRLRGEQYPFLREDDGTPLSYLDVIILGSPPFVSKAYYPGEWKEDARSAPICTSLKGDTPDQGTPQPQASSCGVCPHNEWKQLKTGRRGKECQDQKRLALLLRPEMTTKMLGSPLEEPVFLKVPPGSLNPLKTYGDSLMHRGLPPMSVITRISFNPKQLFQMEFKAVRALKNPEAPPVIALVKDPRTMRIVGLAPRTVAAPAANGPAQEEIVAPSPAVIAAMREAQAAQTAAIRAAAERVAGPQQGTLPLGDVPSPADNTTSWEESSDELDQEVAAALGKKIQAMMK